MGNGRFGGHRGGGGRGRGGSGRGGGGGRGGRRGGGSFHRGGGGGGGRGGRGRGRGGRGRNLRQSSDSGNLRERIAIESGALVLIDQFMLANPQFIEKFVKIIDESAEVKEDLIKSYGGSVVQLEPGTYRIDRDPFAFSIIIRPEGAEIDGRALTKENTKESGHVFVDTRCVAMVDRELLDDTSLLEKYQGLWFGGQDKACRDLLRDNGGAVRYGFNRYGDELSIYVVPGENVVCLWPDVIEPVAAEAVPEQPQASSL